MLGVLTAMDWAVKTAKRKTRYTQGSSRSILESLNKFSDVLSEGQDKISSTCNASNEWLNHELRAMSYIIGQDKHIASPERSSAEEEIIVDKKTPKRTENLITHATPKSLPIDDIEHKSHLDNSSSDVSEKFKIEGKLRNESNATDDVKQRKHPESQDLALEETKYTSNASTLGTKKDVLKSSPWSPYKTERTLQVTDYNHLQDNSPKNEDKTEQTKQRTKSSEIFDAHRQEQVNTEILRRSELRKKKEDHSLSNTDQRIPLSIRDRSQRRSNMFVPLPNKDPLVVQALSSNLSKRRVSVTEKNLDGGRSHNSTANRSSFAMSLPPNKGRANHGSSSGNVFDRLSSIPTKSSEKKALSRSPVREPRGLRHGKSAADVTGSPAERRKPRIVDHSNQSIKDTLKNIFDSQIPKLTQSATMRHSKNDRVNPVLTNKSGIKRNSLIPKLSGRTMVSPGSNNIKTDPQNNRISPTPKYTHAFSPHHQRRKTATQTINVDDSNTPITALNTNRSDSAKFTEREDGKEGRTNTLFDQSKELRETKTITSNNDLGDGIPLQKRSLDEAQLKDQPPTKVDSIALKKARTSHDRLTKFQLIPLVGSEKQDIKKKLDKRLSEVMRTQKEQQRKRQDQLRRKTQLDEDMKKRKTRQLYEATDFSRVSRVQQPSVPVNDNFFNSLSRNTMLFDLNSTDHRELIGVAADEESPAGDQTLPDIDSDSEAEDDKILAAWAQTPYLQEHLLEQQNWDPESIFGPIPPLHIDEVFQNSRLSKLKSRQSLAKTNSADAMESRRD